MNPTPAYSGPDPLSRARRQLDFAKLAETAPSAREILFKSQTFVPLAPPRPWSRIGAAAGGVLALALLVLLPWVPQRSSLVTVSAFFDKLMARQDAQTAINKIDRDIEPGVLLGAFFAPQGQVPPASEQGRLTLSFTCADRSEENLMATVRALLNENMPQLPPDHLQPVQMGGSRRVSPFMLAQQYLGDRGSGKKDAVPGSHLAAQVLKNQDLIAKRLARALRSDGLELTSFAFVAPSVSPRPGPDEFLVSAWPSRVLAGVHDYGTRTVEEQTGIRSRVEQFLGRINLGVSSALLTDAPSEWQPVVVEVLGPGGLTDRYLTDRLQAWVEQPTESELMDINFDVVRRVEDALQKVVGDRECRIDYELVDIPGASRVMKLYRVSVSLTGARRDMRPEPAEYDPGEEEDTEY